VGIVWENEPHTTRGGNRGSALCTAIRDPWGLKNFLFMAILGMVRISVLYSLEGMIIGWLDSSNRHCYWYNVRHWIKGYSEGIEIENVPGLIALDGPVVVEKLWTSLFAC